VGPSAREPDTAAAITAGGGTATAVTAALVDAPSARAAFATASRALGPLDLVVLVSDAPAVYTVAPLAETDPAGWDVRCEAVLRSALGCARAAYAQLHQRGGRFVAVTPTVSLTGAAGLVPAVTAAEGLRALVKSAARQWGATGITANCVAVPLALVAPDQADADPTVDEPALGHPPDARADVAAVVALLASDAAGTVTGATLAVDGGVVMTP